MPDFVGIARQGWGRALTLIVLAVACSGRVEERRENQDPGGAAGTAVNPVGGAGGDAGRPPMGGAFGDGGSVGAYGNGFGGSGFGSGGYYGDAGSPSFGGSSFGSGGIIGAGGFIGGGGDGVGGSGGGGSEAYPPCPNVLGSCMTTECIDPNSPAPPVPDVDGGPRDAAAPDAVHTIEGGPSDAAPVNRESGVVPVTMMTAALCSDGGSVQNPKYLAFDLATRLNGYPPVVALFSGQKPCGGRQLGQVALGISDTPPANTFVTQCIRTPQNLGKHLTFVSLNFTTMVQHPRFVAECDCVRPLTPSNTCDNTVASAGSGCE